MREIDIIRDTHFEEVTEVRADSKNRITLGKRRGAAKANIFYRIYRNDLGQIILDPQATVPAHEEWLFKNKKAANSLHAGLDDAKKGKLVKAREDYSKYLTG